jgi:hypothetical protein
MSVAVEIVTPVTVATGVGAAGVDDFPHATTVINAARTMNNGTRMKPPHVAPTSAQPPAIRTRTSQITSTSSSGNRRSKATISSMRLAERECPLCDISSSAVLPPQK